jgi:uncharacterized membrane protein YcfT
MKRLAWVDTARGVAISLVALLHATKWLVAGGLVADGWLDANVVLSSIRMPVFFAIAGLFAMKWLQGAWSSLLRDKVLLFVWVYLIWEVVGSAVGYAGMGLNGDRTSVLRVVRDLILSPVLPRFELWFIWALALFFVLAKLTRKVDPRIQLAVAGMMSFIALSGWTFANVGWGGALRYYFFFLIGLYLRDQVFAFSRVRSRTVQSAVVVSWLATGTVLVTFDLQDVPGVYFGNCVLGLLAGICLGRALARIVVLAYLGSRTLPIYLGHTPIIITTVIILSGVGAISAAPRPVGLLLPAILPPLAIALALLVNRLATWAGLDWLYAPPRRLARALFGTDDSHPGATRADPRSAEQT